MSITEVFYNTLESGASLLSKISVCADLCVVRCSGWQSYQPLRHSAVERHQRAFAALAVSGAGDECCSRWR